MSSVLPQGKVAASRINPKIIVLYGMPKVGKTTALAELDDCVILDAESGTEMIDAVKIPITSINGATVRNPSGKLLGTSLYQVFNDTVAQATADKAAGRPVKYPFRRIALDTLDQIEDMAIGVATEKYKKTVIGKTFEGDSILDLPKGSGYYHIRNEVIAIIDMLTTICETLILVTHVKEKLLNKGGVDVSMNDISLTGKLGSIVCAKADLIGYMYREPAKPLMISFETSDSAVMGSRVTRLAGQRFPLDWSRIFLEKEAS